MLLLIGGGAGGIVGDVDSGTLTITNCYYLEPISSEAIGSGTATEGSYYGIFSSPLSSVMQTSSESLVYRGDILTVLNAYRNATLTYDGINLKLWEIRAGENDGYPVFA